jgi:alkyl hydroperoxide reductase subunit AhpF
MAKNGHVETPEFHMPIEIHGDGKEEGLTVKNYKNGEIIRLDLNGLFMEINLFPNADFLIGLIEINKCGEILADDHRNMGARGAFAAVDAVDSYYERWTISAGSARGVQEVSNKNKKGLTRVRIQGGAYGLPTNRKLWHCR